MKITSNDVGKWCLIHFDDIGTVQALILEKPDSYKDFDVFIPCDTAVNNANADQVVRIGERITVTRMTK